MRPKQAKRKTGAFLIKSRNLLSAWEEGEILRNSIRLRETGIPSISFDKFREQQEKSIYVKINKTTTKKITKPAKKASVCLCGDEGFSCYLNGILKTAF